MFISSHPFLSPSATQACAEAGTDYIDISGEPEFIEKMELEYSAVAAKNVSGLPSGTVFLG